MATVSMVPILARFSVCDFNKNSNNKLKILLDTDIGFGEDSDDSVCLAYLLLQPACDLLGVTTVGMDSDTRAQIVEVLARNMGINNLHVAAGCDTPFVSNLWWGHPRKRQKLNARPLLQEYPAEKTYKPNSSVKLMQEIVREIPEK